MVKLRYFPAGAAKAPLVFLCLMPLAACDMLGEENEGTHRAVVTLEEKRVQIGFQARDAAPNETPEVALECVAADDLGAAYPMTVSVRLGRLPEASAEQTPEGDWRLGARLVPNKLAFVIGGRAFDTQNRRLARAPDGAWALVGDLPVYDTLYEAIARARFVQVTNGEARHTLAVAAWRKELIEAAARCEKYTLAWQFTR